jgi:hypothetical protein
VGKKKKRRTLMGVIFENSPRNKRIKRIHGWGRQVVISNGKRKG